MKKQIILFTTLLITGFSTLFSQVGIGTANALGIFHIDGKQNNPPSGLPNDIEQEDDFIFTTEGKVGIGTINPQGALEISSTKKTFMPPRMTSVERDDLFLPPSGSIIFNTSDIKMQANVGTANFPIWSYIETGSNTTNKSLVVTQAGYPAYQQNVKINDVILMSVTLFNNIPSGYVTYSSTTGIFTLQPGKTYKLEFAANWVNTSANRNWARFRWYNYTVNDYQGMAQHFEMAPHNAAGFSMNGGSSILLIKPTVATQIAPRYYAGDGNVQLTRIGNGSTLPYANVTILD